MRPPRISRLHELRTRERRKRERDHHLRSLKSGLVVRATEETSQFMDVVVAQADGSEPACTTTSCEESLEVLPDHGNAAHHPDFEPAANHPAEAGSLACRSIMKDSAAAVEAAGDPSHEIKLHSKYQAPWRQAGCDRPALFWREPARSTRFSLV